MKILSFFCVAFFFMLLLGCETKKKSLFRLVDAGDSGIDFRNDMFESEQLNILNIDYFYNGGGVAIGDFNNDGLNDIFFTGNMVPNKLYLNKGDLEFDDVSEAAGIGGYYKWKSGVALVDVNNDGWLDIYVCATISPDSVLRTNMLFVNQGVDEKGDIKFIDQAKDYGIADSGYSANAAFLDYDVDGDLDLYILTNEKQFGSTLTYRPKVNDGSSVNTDKLYRNNGNGTFTNVAREAGILCEGHGLGIAVADINRDGLPDVYVGNDYLTNDVMYVNKGSGLFENEIDEWIKHQSRFSMGNDVSDINNDGHLDVITLDMLPETNFRKKTVMGSAGYITYINDKRFGYAHQYVRNMLQLNNGNGTFSEIGQLAGVYQTEWSWAPLFADLDNDGFKDLFITNGFPKDITDRDFISYREKVHGLVGVNDLLKEVPSVKVPNYVFKNNGDLTFSDVSKEWGFDQPSFSNGAAYADLDNDGDLDCVINNINDVASLYENTLYSGRDKEGSKSNHFLRIKLKGAVGNLSGLGTKITLMYDDRMQYHEHSIYRGYISTVEDVVHFGLGSATHIDTIFVEWPDGKKHLVLNQKADQLLVIDHKTAQQDLQRPGKLRDAAPVMVKDVSAQTGIHYIHAEEDKIDFNVQRTLPHKLSQSGPGIAVGDVNQDGLEDFYVGGAAGFPGSLFLQRGNGSFALSQPFGSKEEEDTGILLFDADGDGDLDMYVVSGSYEFEPGSQKYQDRLYKNDGKGKFKVDMAALPAATASGSCVRAADFDSDGDLDLFVGGRVPPGKYPLADESFLLRNNGGVFSNVTNKLCPELTKAGMVTDAIWSDFDNDGKVDLVVVGEFMAVTFFRNINDRFEKIGDTGIDRHTGWFNSVAGGDFDNDGDVDYVAGNLGLNNYYCVSYNQPLEICAKDFDGNGSMDAVLSCYTKAEDGTMKSYPAHFWEDLNSQSPQFRQQFNYYREFAQTTTDQLFSPEDVKDALKLSANYMATSYIENKGDGKFSITPLPVLAQVAPVNGIVVDDVDMDGNLDILMIGNDYGNEVTAGQYDAFTGLVLKGDGSGKFEVVPSVKSGFFVNGDAKGLVRLFRKNGDLYIATQNRDSIKVFSRIYESGHYTIEPEPLDQWAELTYHDGKKKKVEFYYGSGYLSQSTRATRIPENVNEVVVYNSRGESRKLTLSAHGKLAMKKE